MKITGSNFTVGCTGMFRFKNTLLSFSIKAISIAIVALCPGGLRAQTSGQNVQDTLLKQHDFIFHRINVFINDPVNTDKHYAMMAMPAMTNDRQPAVNLYLPVYQKHSLFKKPVLAHDFNLDVSPEFKAKFKRSFVPARYSRWIPASTSYSNYSN